MIIQYLRRSGKWIVRKKADGNGPYITIAKFNSFIEADDYRILLQQNDYVKFQLTRGRKSFYEKHPPDHFDKLSKAQIKHFNEFYGLKKRVVT